MRPQPLLLLLLRSTRTHSRIRGSLPSFLSVSPSALPNLRFVPSQRHRRLSICFHCQTSPLFGRPPH
uniref:Uncharacterized protein n=1 Tax=Cucumis melo TaxID=3656 RepID=A0A9I9E4C4_CUCME